MVLDADGLINWLIQDNIKREPLIQNDELLRVDVRIPSSTPRSQTVRD
jgi:hypothetical protein